MFFERIDQTMLCQDYWVHSLEKNAFVQVKEIHEDGMLSKDGQSFLFEEISGIEINRDWLLAAGFEQRADNCYEKTGFPFVLIPHTHIVVLFNNEQLTAFRFVHELQHFYAGIKQRPLIIDYAPIL